jgi:hypothetical protein
MTNIERNEHSDSRFPRTYRIDKSARRFFQGFAIFLVVLFSTTSVLHLMGAFARPLSHRDLAWMDLLVVLFAIWLSWWANQRVTLWENAIELAGWFSKRKLRRDEIRGIRMGRTPVMSGGTSFYVIVPADPGKRELKLPPFLRADESFYSWMKAIPHIKS